MKRFLLNIYNKYFSRYGWHGNYSSWAEAARRCSGYDAPEILKRVRTATALVRDGKVAYERDSVTFQTVQHNWPLLACLLRAAAESESTFNVVDFGGSLGSVYYQCANFLPSSLKIVWTVVEQPNFVEIGRAEFETSVLRFRYTLEEATCDTAPSFILFSSVVQYLEDYQKVLEKVANMGIPYVLIDRTPFAEIPSHIITVQRVHPSIYPASYTSWVFNYHQFKKQIPSNYSVIAEFNSFVGSNYWVNGRRAGDRGLFLKKRERAHSGR